MDAPKFKDYILPLVFLKRLSDVFEDERARAEQNLPGEVFAVYWLLNRAGVKNPETASQQMATAFGEHPHWLTSPSHERSVRKELYKALLATGMKEDKVSDLAQQVMNVVRRVQR